LEALVYGTTSAFLGVLDLFFFTTALAAFLAVATLVTYLFLYTPLKRVTPWSTVVGGVPGALPPVIGWAAVKGEITWEAWVLFAILFFWQMPHFFSLAWIYRKDYEKGGYKMLTVVDPSGATTSAHILVYTALLVLASLVPTFMGFSGVLHASSALLLGTGFMGAGIRLRVTRTNESARRLFLASLAYLPALLALMIIDRM
jgi:protoheme IX farnesyltransferase